MGFVLVCAPPSTYLLPVHSPMTLPPPFGPDTVKCPSHVPSVVSLHLDGLLRADASGLLHPKADRGSLHFAMHTPSAIGRNQPPMAAKHHSAQCGSHPSKNSPRQQPYRVTAAVALLPFGSLANRPSTEALVRPVRAPTSQHRLQFSSVPKHRRSGASMQKSLDDSAVRALAPPTTTLCRAEAPQ